MVDGSITFIKKFVRFRQAVNGTVQENVACVLWFNESKFLVKNQYVFCGSMKGNCLETLSSRILIVLSLWLIP